MSFMKVYIKMTTIKRKCLSHVFFGGLRPAVGQAFDGFFVGSDLL